MKSSKILISVTALKYSGIKEPRLANKQAGFDIVSHSGTLQSEQMPHLEETNPSV